MNKSRVALKSTQRGATLVIALLLMVMIALYGIPAAMNSIQNERMTGNTRQRDLAFQFAEHALNGADTWIVSKTAAYMEKLAPASTTCPSGNADPKTDDWVLIDGQCHSNNVAYWQAFNWEGTNVRTATMIGALPNGGDAVTRYIVERMPDVTYCDGKVLTGGTCTGVTAIKHYYRITARGVGQDSNAVVILQTMYEFTK